jgi:glycosyltransferase involved in cell wall biosynthesis
MNIMKKVSILTPDFSHNCLGRALVIAELINEKYSLEIVGPALKQRIWEPALNPPENVGYKYISCSKGLFYSKKAHQLARSVGGDIIIISKAVLPSLYMAALIPGLRKKRVIIDIDDWELGFELDRFKKSGAKGKIKTFVNICKLIFCETVARGIKYKIVSNTFLQKKFGGDIIPHVRDTDRFDPALCDAQRAKERYGIPAGKSIVMFMGTPRRHKGLDELTEAFKKAAIDKAVLLLAGFDLEDRNQKQLHDELKSALGENCVILPQQPFEKIPELLSTADVIVIPQQNTLSSIGQIPAKLFDALAMAKPVIASRINDIPAILKNCGWTYEPGNSNDLAEKLKYALEHPDEAKRVGENARRECVAKYSIHAMRPKMEDVLQKAAGN